MSFRRTTDKQFEARIEDSVQGSLSTRVDEAIISLRENEADLDLLEKGWAMKNKRSGERIPQNSKDYVVAAALKAEKEKRNRVDFKKLAAKMREERNQDGSLIFNPREILTYKQIGAIFARLPKKIHGKTTEQLKHEAERTVEELLNEDGDEEWEMLKDSANIHQEDIIANNIANNLEYIFGEEQEIVERNEKHDDL